MSKTYNFNNSKNQHLIDTARVRLGNMAWQAEKDGRKAQAAYYESKRDHLTKMMGEYGILSNPYLIPMPWEVWKYFTAVADWARGGNMVACAARGIDYME